ncbi:hypothetical protein SEA_DAUBENSKI_191 [Streptomyces phage Daubenski]|uniref:Uncharacterized protein n=1 Tax=Streptomyces phage Daubenski TaxID=2653725 RepID=A0A5Q2WIF7_9CAUD|nr:hypothetical protein KNU80_gp109 [Streptomyces phage Daubenski]QGH76463.1 hypothetical protein SEA_DAUBENSKI_191 [Streptomyces phage Daubenski]
MFEVIGFIVVTLVWGWVALIPFGIAMLPSDMPNWQRLLCFAISAGIVVGWFLLMGPFIHISMG